MFLDGDSHEANRPSDGLCNCTITSKGDFLESTRPSLPRLGLNRVQEATLFLQQQIAKPGNDRSSLPCRPRRPPTLRNRRYTKRVRDIRLRGLREYPDEAVIEWASDVNLSGMATRGDEISESAHGGR